MDKYARLRARVQAELTDVDLVEPEPATNEVLALAHDPTYVHRAANGLLNASEQRTIGFPWSEQMVERSRRSVGATIGACCAALVERVAVNLAGGTHHAMRDAGQGYCVFNDAAIAARFLQREHVGVRRLRVAIIDLDVHQGNGTASILANEDTTFTFSIHCASNFPFRKAHSDLDIALDEGTGDAAYLEALEHGLAQVAARFAADFIIYVAGADAHCGDRLGRLKLSTGGLAARDERVFEFARRLDVPIAVTMAGGYGYDIDQTVEVHFNTVRVAASSWRADVNAQRRKTSLEL